MSTDTLDSPARFGSGRAVKRIEDEGLLKGLGQYTDDIAPAGQLRAVFVRSPYPHARIVSIDTSGAEGLPGVLKVATGAELVQAGVIDPATILTQAQPLTSAIEAYAAFDRREPGWLKVKLEPPQQQRKAA